MWNMKWYHTVVLFHISLMANNFEHLFMWLLILISSLEKCPFMSFVHFFIWIVEFLLLSCRDSLYILNIRDLTDIWFINICPLVWNFYEFLVVSFGTPFIKILMKSHVSIFFFCCFFFKFHNKKPLPKPRSWQFTRMFSFNNFIVLALVFRFLFLYELSVVYGRGKGPS